MTAIKILSIDGGGIRGIIPAIILSEIEERTGKPIAELFDFIAGTSTGGLLTLGLTKPNSEGRPQYSANDLIQLYETEGKTIFHRSESITDKMSHIWRRKFYSDGIEGVLKKYFDDTLLSQALNEMLITSYDVENCSPYFFKRYKAQYNQDKHDFLMAEVARATSAAPTYFEPLKLQSNHPSLPYKALIDGGVFANNPTMCAYVEAKKLYPETTDFLVVSIGTGKTVHRLKYKDIQDWGIIQWAQPMLNVVFDGVSDAVDYQMRQILPKNRYYYFQTEALNAESTIDNPSDTHINELKGLATEILYKQASELEELCNELTKKTVHEK
ncbi:MAG: CBASS cGAMP-activated phospholipase [Calothrix sp. MO_167.B42]|nr:CBASS cGAMP-activated phospholipase [Calothrix sp. MO_167.B42]